MSKEQKNKRLQLLQNLKKSYEMNLQELSKKEGNEKIIDKMLEMLFKLLQEIKELENELK